jgi:hypothetical protein
MAEVPTFPTLICPTAGKVPFPRRTILLAGCYVTLKTAQPEAKISITAWTQQI